MKFAGRGDDIRAQPGRTVSAGEGLFLRHDSFSLADREDAIHGGKTGMLNRAAGPVNLHTLHFRAVSKAEMKSRIIRGRVTASADYVSTLANAPGHKVNGCSNRIARTPGASHKLELNPVILVGIHISQQDRGVIQLIDDDINLAVVEKIAERRTSLCQQKSQAGSLDRRDKFKLSIAQVAEQ